MEKIYIIGAGIAGIAAAKELKKRGISATILEARDRIGGRIWTDYSWGLPISLGAQWMHGTEGNPVTALADKLKVKYTRSSIQYLLCLDRYKNPIPPQETYEFYHFFDE